MSTATQSTPAVSKDGEHWEQHGPTVYHAPQFDHPENRATAAPVATFSYGSKHRTGDVLLSVGREPFSLVLYLAPEDADQLADNLRRAAAQARAVRALKAQRKAVAEKTAEQVPPCA